MNEIPPQLLETPIHDWQLNLVTLFVIMTILGRAYAAIKNNGGLIGIYKSIVFGSSSVPKKDENSNSNPK